MAAVAALVHEENGTYGISFPDFPGIVAGGSSVEHAIERGREGVAALVEILIERGTELPVPRPIAEIRSDPSWAEALTDAMIVVVPLDLPSRAVRVNVTLDQALLDRIDRAAENRGESRSGFLAAAARARLTAGQ